jgi:hypothetical protein
MSDGSSSGRVGKYMLYATGEIILVVFGILIALQVNNWNENRKSKIEEAHIVEEIHSEFSDNRTVLKERIKTIENANESVEIILSLINAEQEEYLKYNLDSIFSKSLAYGNYNPSNSTIQEIIASGKLNLIRNKELKKSLYAWLQMLKDSDEDFKNQDQQATTLLIPYIYKHLSSKNINNYSNYFRLGLKEKSELFSNDYYPVFHDLEFENLYQGKLFWNSVMVNHYKELDSLAIEILNQT